MTTDAFGSTTDESWRQDKNNRVRELMKKRNLHDAYRTLNPLVKPKTFVTNKGAGKILDKILPTKNTAPTNVQHLEYTTKFTDHTAVFGNQPNESKSRKRLLGVQQQTIRKSDLRKTNKTC